MRVFNKKSFVEFVRRNDDDNELYISNVGIGSKEDCFEYDMKIVDDVFDGDGVYCIEFGSRGEVEFFKVNLCEELIEWNNIVDDDFKYMRDDIGNDYLDLNWYEECIRCYFIVCLGGK